MSRPGRSHHEAFRPQKRWRLICPPVFYLPLPSFCFWSWSEGQIGDGWSNVEGWAFPKPPSPELLRA